MNKIQGLQLEFTVCAYNKLSFAVFNIGNTLLVSSLLIFLLGKDYAKEYLLADLNSINFISLSWSF